MLIKIWYFSELYSESIKYYGFANNVDVIGKSEKVWLGILIILSALGGPYQNQV